MKSKTYQSITFQVEKGLKSPQEYYPVIGIKNIFGSLFEKRKVIIDQYGNKKFLEANEPLEILHYEFDTEKLNFLIKKKFL